VRDIGDVSLALEGAFETVASANDGVGPARDATRRAGLDRGNWQCDNEAR
jgi:hypothetical protein